jgi:hypothetical protein
VLTDSNPGHDIPAAVTSPHDQRAHDLLQDLTNYQCPRVLTRRPLPEPSLPNSPAQAIRHPTRAVALLDQQPRLAEPAGSAGRAGIAAAVVAVWSSGIVVLRIEDGGGVAGFAMARAQCRPGSLMAVYQRLRG